MPQQEINNEEPSTYNQIFGPDVVCLGVWRKHVTNYPCCASKHVVNQKTSHESKQSLRFVNNYLTPTRLPLRNFLSIFFMFFFHLRFLFFSPRIVSTGCKDAIVASVWETFCLKWTVVEMFGYELFPPCGSNNVDHPLLFATCRPWGLLTDLFFCKS